MPMMDISTWKLGIMSFIMPMMDISTWKLGIMSFIMPMTDISPYEIGCYGFHHADDGHFSVGNPGKLLVLSE
jgi:hypothetical protein